MAQLTLGRGGRFVDDGDGRLRYLPSGREPLLVAGSRGGLPLPARGRNQKRPDHTYRPRILTVARIRQRRARGPLDFRTCVLPFLLAEIDLVYCETVARMRGVPDVPDVLTCPTSLSDVDQLGPRRALARLRERLGLTDLPALDLEALARPFVDREFASPQEYHGRRPDLDRRRPGGRRARQRRRAAQGRARRDPGRPRGAAGGGRLRWAVGRVARGLPGLVRAARLVPVRGAADDPPGPDPRAAGRGRPGHLAGPDTRFETGPDGFVVRSPQVAGSARTVQVLLDARMPVPHLDRDTSELSRQLRARGVLTTWTNESGPRPTRTGGVAVTRAPFHPIGENGIDPALHVLGIPTEHIRWFTQVGSGRPRVWTGFTADADAVAADLLAGPRRCRHSTQTCEWRSRHERRARATEGTGGTAGPRRTSGSGRPGTSCSSCAPIPTGRRRSSAGRGRSRSTGLWSGSTSSRPTTPRRRWSCCPATGSRRCG